MRDVGDSRIVMGCRHLRDVHAVAIRPIAKGASFIAAAWPERRP